MIWVPWDGLVPVPVKVLEEKLKNSKAKYIHMQISINHRNKKKHLRKQETEMKIIFLLGTNSPVWLLKQNFVAQVHTWVYSFRLYEFAAFMIHRQGTWKIHVSSFHPTCIFAVWHEAILLHSKKKKNGGFDTMFLAFCYVQSLNWGRSCLCGNLENNDRFIKRNLKMQ